MQAVPGSPTEIAHMQACWVRELEVAFAAEAVVSNRRLVEAIEKLGGRVTKADLLSSGSAAAGLERELLELARSSGAALRVSEMG
eukprot:CAMPEP_0197688826 /NCGR_PEP_ID=MMETSP1338-20131121/106012_1 /TAXON_ID=43686 ORGANISM="Pelagodinium beii, Strain RCC1491" /NCGR_SAMPLE_ID=MMETSP1338 /ASSEMBLY_ACC=CAM_ASM_000754 /LENGTH=84 /DNA_ID=CAMNT_0043271087 /DNA_START=52 /DNA_END=304 /DNA_ORIENTATION=+